MYHRTMQLFVGKTPGKYKKINNTEIYWWYRFVYCKEADIDDDNNEEINVAGGE